MLDIKLNILYTMNIEVVFNRRQTEITITVNIYSFQQTENTNFIAMQS